MPTVSSSAQCGDFTEFFRNGVHHDLPADLWSRFAHWLPDMAAGSEVRLTHYDADRQMRFDMQVGFGDNLFTINEGQAYEVDVTRSNHPEIGAGETIGLYVGRSSAGDKYAGVGLTAVNAGLRHRIIQTASRSNVLMVSHYAAGSDPPLVRKNGGTAGNNAFQVDSAFGRTWVR